MNRGKPSLKKTSRVCLVLDQEHLDCIKKAAIHLSVKEGRLITPSELMRLALEERYPVSESLNLESNSLDKCKIG